MIRQGFRPGRIFPERGVHGHIFLPVPFLGLASVALAVIGSLDPEQVVRGRGQAGLPPAGFKDRLGDRQGRQNPVLLHVGGRHGADLVDEGLLVGGSLRGRRAGLGRLRLGRVGIVDIGKAAVFGPLPGVVAGLLADVRDGRDLDPVFPFRGTLHGQAVADIDADVAFQPHGFAGDHVGPAGLRPAAGTLRDHTVRPDVGDAVHGVAGAAIGSGRVAGPPPQDALDQTNAIKAEDRRGLISGRLDHSGPGALLVVVVIRTVAGHVLPGQGRAEAPHDIQGLVILRDVDQLVDEGFTFHHCFSLLPVHEEGRGFLPALRALVLFGPAVDAGFPDVRVQVRRPVFPVMGHFVAGVVGVVCADGL